MSLEKLAKLVDTYAGLVRKMAMDVNAAMKEADRLEPIMKQYIANPGSYADMKAVYDQAYNVLKVLNSHRVINPNSDPVAHRRAKFDQVFKDYKKTVEHAQRMETGGTRARSEITEAEKKKLAWAVLRAIQAVGYEENLLAAQDYRYDNARKGHVAYYYVHQKYTDNLTKFNEEATAALNTLRQSDNSFPVVFVSMAIKPGESYE